METGSSGETKPPPDRVIVQGNIGGGVPSFEKGWYLNELPLGLPFHGAVFVVRNVDAQIKRKGPRLTCTFHDATGECKAKSWNPPDSLLAELERKPTLVRVSGRVDDNAAYAGEILIEELVALDSVPADLTPYLDALPPGQKQTWARFTDLIRSVHDTHLTLLLKAIFDKETQRRFSQAVAAKEHHHAFRGGLLEHTIEVAELCQHACVILPELNHDLLVTGALLHDIGKLDEMEQGLQAGEYTVPGTLQGHLYLGARRVEQAASGVPNFPPLLASALVHLLLSHHGCAAYGSPAPPSFAEAVVLSQCDVISARAYACRAAKAEARGGQLTVRRALGEAQRVYVGSLGVPEEAEETLPSPWDEGELEMPLPPPLPAARMPLPRKAIDPRGQNRFGVALSGAGNGLVTLPVLGRVAAGAGDRSAEASGEPETRTVLPPAGGADYLLYVTGDSMTGAGIMEGDLLFVRAQSTARDGDIVVANLPGDGQVVKRYKVTPSPKPGAGPRVALHSENPAYAPLPFAEDMRIQGRAVGLLRDF